MGSFKSLTNATIDPPLRVSSVPAEQPDTMNVVFGLHVARQDRERLLSRDGNFTMPRGVMSASER